MSSSFKIRSDSVVKSFEGIDRSCKEKIIFRGQMCVIARFECCLSDFQLLVIFADITRLQQIFHSIPGKFLTYPRFTPIIKYIRNNFFVRCRVRVVDI